MKSSQTGQNDDQNQSQISASASGPQTQNNNPNPPSPCRKPSRLPFDGIPGYGRWPEEALAKYVLNTLAELAWAIRLNIFPKHGNDTDLIELADSLWMAEAYVENNEDASQPLRATRANGLIGYSDYTISDAYHLACFALYENAGMLQDWLLDDKKKHITTDQELALAESLAIAENFVISEGVDTEGRHIFQEFATKTRAKHIRLTFANFDATDKDNIQQRHTLERNARIVSRQKLWEAA